MNKKKNYKGRRVNRDDLILIFCGVMFVAAHLAAEMVCF